MDEPAEQSEDSVPLDTYLAMTARILGRIQACEAVLIAMIRAHDDADALARQVDALILADEASRIAAHRTDEETMQTHEWAQQAATALFANAARGRR